MNEQTPWPSEPIVQIPFVDSAGDPRPSSVAGQPYALNEVLNRLESCSGVAASELEDYRSSMPAGAIKIAHDYLLSVVIPVYNEEHTIARVISRVTSLPLNTELVSVDDYSTDGTRDLLKHLDGLDSVKLILKEQNAG